MTAKGVCIPSSQTSFPRNHESRHRSTRHRKARTNQHYNSESEYKCFFNGNLDGGLRCGIEVTGRLQAGEFDLICLKVTNNVRRQRETSQAVVQPRTKSLDHYYPKNSDRKYSGYARHGVVDSRS